jgi:hypothetical protein
MSQFRQSEFRGRPARAPRQKLTHPTPAVLRFPSGGQVRARLQVISITGGLLFLPNLLDRGTCGKLMFLTDSGAVLGTAEMLIPISTSLQPFRFVAIDSDDQSRIKKSVRDGAEQNMRDRLSIYYDRAW